MQDSGLLLITMAFLLGKCHWFFLRTITGICFQNCCVMIFLSLKDQINHPHDLPHPVIFLLAFVL
jgi:hypothetical protein